MFRVLGYHMNSIQIEKENLNELNTFISDSDEPKQTHLDVPKNKRFHTQVCYLLTPVAYSMVRGRSRNI